VACALTYCSATLRIKVLRGDDWLKFLSNCRFTLGCESGSSLLDPRGEIRAACNAYLRRHPKSEFDEIEAACFPGQDMKRVFSAFSPRLFEAALAGACQVLVPGKYLGVLEPDQHYIPLAADFSNIGDVWMSCGIGSVLNGVLRPVVAP